MRQRVDEFGKVRTNACEKVRRGYLRMGEHGGRYLYEMEGADEEVEGHVVGVVEAREEGEVGDVCEEDEGAERGPEDEYAGGRGGGRGGVGETGARGGGVEVEEADDGVVEAVEDGEGRGEVVELLCPGEVCAHP